MKRKIADIKIYLKKLRNEKGVCVSLSKNKFNIFVDTRKLRDSKAILSVLLHEFVHVLFYLLESEKFLSYLCRDKDDKVVTVSEKYISKIEEKVCNGVEKCFKKLFEKYL